MNPFADLKYIHSSKELLDIAFARASKLTLAKSKKPMHVQKREKEIAKLRKVEDLLTSRLDEVVRKFPNFDEIHPFYRTLADTVVSIDELRQALASVSSSIRIIKNIVRDNQRNLSRAENPSTARQLRQAAYGRISSVINRLEPRLTIIQRAARNYKRFPSINLKLPVIVVSGFPNVGKSSLVQHLSSARPEIAEYPFTTKKISVGHFPLNSFEGQILDIPGLLDRPMSDRNPIEKRAIAAIEYMADFIIFLIDPTLTCGYELANQFNLYQEIKTVFPGLEISPVLNKSDIASEEEIRLANELFGSKDLPLVCAVSGDGVDTVFHKILNQSLKIQEKLNLLRNQSH